jgi:hypothetical protein
MSVRVFAVGLGSCLFTWGTHSKGHRAARRRWLGGMAEKLAEEIGAIGCNPENRAFWRRFSRAEARRAQSRRGILSEKSSPRSLRLCANHSAGAGFGAPILNRLSASLRSRSRLQAGAAEYRASHRRQHVVQRNVPKKGRFAAASSWASADAIFRCVHPVCTCAYGFFAQNRAGGRNIFAPAARRRGHFMDDAPAIALNARFGDLGRQCGTTFCRTTGKTRAREPQEKKTRFWGCDSHEPSRASGLSLLGTGCCRPTWPESCGGHRRSSR